jgi:Na+/H+ antiporter NhaD/arsenite permease-like protein
VQNLIQNKRLLIESSISIVMLMVCFILIPSQYLSPDMIALTIALILIIISKLKPKEIISKIDLELILYLIGIFVIAGALQNTGMLNSLGNLISGIGGGIYVQLILVLWISAFLSSSIDNIPVTQVLLPVISTMTLGLPMISKNQLYYGLAIGANWGDNLTPLGDNILVIQIAEKNKRPISFKQFFKLGFFTTLYQLGLVTLYYTLIFYVIQGLIAIFIICTALLLMYILLKSGPKKASTRFQTLISSIRDMIIK